MESSSQICMTMICKLDRPGHDRMRDEVGVISDFMATKKSSADEI